jgi:pimeloyl-ACP methyl ester carboxylesterase
MRIVLAHGAGSGPWVFEGWPEEWIRVDLQEGLDVARASMRDYADAIVRALPDAIVGWSLGGLAAMMAARDSKPQALVVLEPSPPAELLPPSNTVLLAEEGVFDPEEVYGAFPAGMRARPESSPARAERKAGISVPSLPCPALVVYGDDFAEERGRAVARFYGAEELYISGLDHWGVVRDPRVPGVAATWLAR